MSTGVFCEANAFFADQLRVEETKVMDILCIPSGKQNYLLAAGSPLNLSNRLQNRYSLPAFIMWQQIGEYLLLRHQQTPQPVLTRV